MSERLARSRRILALAGLAAAVALGTQVVAGADPDPAKPEAIQAAGFGQGTAPAARIAIPAEDAEAFAREHGAKAAAGASVNLLRGGAQPVASQGAPPRTIALETPEVVNHSTQLQFRDVTERTQDETRSEAVRRSAVEAYRQSLSKPAP